MLHLKAVCWVWKGKAKTMAEESGGNSSTEDVTQPFPVNFRRSEMGLNCWDGLWISFASSRGSQLTGSLGPWPFHDQWLPIFLRILAIVWLHVFYKNDLANKQLIRTWPQQRLPIATITSNPICLDLGCTHFNKTPQRDRIHLPNMSHSLLHAPGGSCFFFRTCSIAGHAAWVAMVIGKFRRESHGAKGPGCIWSLGSQFDGLNLECENKNQHLLDFVIGKHTLNLTYLSYIYM